MVKYRFGFEDLEGNAYVAELSNADYTGAVVPIEGKARLNRDRSGSVLQPLWITSYDVTLTATVEQPLSDIYNNPDRYWVFVVWRNGQFFYRGYVSTEGVEQPYNTIVYDLNFEVLESLYFLDDMGYYDADKFAYTTRQSVISILLKALEKGYLPNDTPLELLTCHNLSVSGEDIFENSYLEQSLFYDDDGESISCQKIIENILKSLGCFIVQYNGAHLIVSLEKWIELYRRDVVCARYNTDGIKVGSVTLISLSANKVIGSDVLGAATYHVNDNQRAINTKMFHTVKVRHDLVFKTQLVPNGELVQENGTVDRWSFSGAVTVDGDGVSIPFVTQKSVSAAAGISSAALVDAGEEFVLNINLEYVGDPAGHEFRLILNNTESGTDYVYVAEQYTSQGEIWRNEWLDLSTVDNQILGLTAIRFGPVEGGYIINMPVTALPEKGAVRFEIFSPYHINNTGNCFFRGVTLSALERDYDAVEYTATRTDVDTGGLMDVYTIPYDSSGRNVLSNVFVDVSGVAINGFMRFIGESYPIGYYLASDFMRYFGFTNTYFRGDVYNAKFLGPKEIDEFNRVFLVAKESKDLALNVSSMEFQGINFWFVAHEIVTARVSKAAVKTLIR